MWLFRSADATDAAPMVTLMERARDARLETEATNHATPEIVQAWRKWYDEAIASVSRLSN